MFPNKILLLLLIFVYFTLQIDCPLGYANVNNTCIPCQPGTYSDLGLTCDECPPDYFANETAMRYCWRCPSGTFAENYGSIECTQCPPGTGVALCSKASSVLIHFSLLIFVFVILMNFITK